MWLEGGIYRDFIILLIPTPLVSVLFCSIIPTFCLLKKCFSFFSKTLINNKTAKS